MQVSKDEGTSRQNVYEILTKVSSARYLGDSDVSIFDICDWFIVGIRSSGVVTKHIKACHFCRLQFHNEDDCAVDVEDTI